MAVTKDKPATIALGCTAAGGRPLTYWTTQALRGKVSEPTGPGEVIYPPPAGGLGADSFVITADDGRRGRRAGDDQPCDQEPAAAEPTASAASSSAGAAGPDAAELLAGVRSNLAASVAKLKKKTAASVARPAARR